MNANLTKKSAKEVIFVGLSGLTHNYGGLSPDNRASNKNRGSESNPKQAALQVIALARNLLNLGVTVGILPPQLRPNLPALQEAGFNLENAPPILLEQVSSSSFMWAANAATVTPSCDSSDGNMHFTTANIHTNPHRRMEAQATYNILMQIFRQVPKTFIHPPLDFEQGFLDEGAANHLRLSPNHGALGLHVFVYGKRQNLTASEAVAENHHIPPAQTLFLEQNPEVITQGVFHNDVIAVSNENLLLVHASAYKNGRVDIVKIETAYAALHPDNRLQLIMVGDVDLSVEEAVHSYFFNSQIITKLNGKMAVIAPQELQTLYGGKAARLMEEIRNDSSNSIDEIKYLDLRQSMKNGGGPACLRLRVVLTPPQIAALAENTAVLVDENLLSGLEKLVEKYYPESLVLEDLREVELYNSNKDFLIDLSKLLRISIM